ncbi:MAG: SCO family protein [bacterium JZ-2024 1]
MVGTKETTGSGCERKCIRGKQEKRDLRFIKRCLFSLFFLTVTKSNLFGEEKRPEGVGIVEQLGKYVPLELTFRDETGQSVSLEELMDRPAVVMLIYYKCPGICPVLFNGVAEVVNKMKETPGKDFRILSISFDASDTPEIAQRRKMDTFALLSREIPEEGWKFLTGDEETIRKFTESVGFYFDRVEGEFVHPSGLIVLSPKGRIIRYLYGVEFLPMDLSLAITEADEEKPIFSVRRVVQFCFSYDPNSRRYVLNITRISGAVIALFALSFFLFLTFRSHRPVTDREG